MHLLGRRILAGQLIAGDVLPNEADLGDELGVSRTVVREAIKVLAEKGFVETRPKTGTRILPRSLWKMLDPDVLSWQYEEAEHDSHLLRNLLDMRQLIEPGAAELAASRAGDAEIASLEEAYRAMQHSVHDPDGFIDADMRFHNAILTACRNEFLAQLSAAIETVLRVTRRVTIQVPGSSAASLSLHQTVLEAIRAHDPVAARNAMLDLLSVTVADINRVLHEGTSKTA